MNFLIIFCWGGVGRGAVACKTKIWKAANMGIFSQNLFFISIISDDSLKSDFFE